MASPLPTLRRTLDVMPSPVPERPGLLLRDPFQYTKQILIIPPLLASGLAFFDGEKTDLDLQVHFSRLSGEIIPLELVESLISALKDHGFLETAEFEARRAQRHADFVGASTRITAHAGSAYPENEPDLRRHLADFFRSREPQHAVLREADEKPLMAVAAPHVSPDGGRQSYAAAYENLSERLGENPADLTVVLLGTSHYGQPERFGLTRKPFVTPLGKLEVDTARLDRLTALAPGAVVMEDYCHAIEHSLEFQCIFLQQALGSTFRILPILCGPFAEATSRGTAPENDESVHRFFDALTGLASVDQRRLLWVLGVDMAHIGRRYGDTIVARANEDQMIAVAEQDRARLDLVCKGDPETFLQMVVDHGDPLKWCGFSPIYTFLRSAGNTQGRVMRYDQWNIDEQSVVSFAALEFREK